MEAMTRDPFQAPVSESERVMLRYAARLTLEPAQITAADVTELRRVGWDDRAIHDICAITAYFNFVNRIADGLGVELEDRFQKGAGSDSHAY